MKRHLLPALLAIALTPMELFADETIAIVGRLSDGTVPVVEDADSPRSYDVLDSFERQLPDRKLTIQRVRPPEISTADAVTDSTSMEDTPAAKTVLTLVATVVDHQASILQWTYQGDQYLAWSNIDFNYLTGFTEFRKGDKHYVNLMPVSNIGSASLPAGIRIPDELDVSGPAFLPVQGDFSVYEAYEAVEVLHELFLMEGSRLIEAYELREARRREAEAELTSSPPAPKDIVLRYWEVEPSKAREAAE